MTIGVAQRVRHLPFRGTDDPSLPIGVWQADVDSPGDASGGQNSCDIIFNNAGEIDDNFYSLEQFGDQHDVVTGTVHEFIVNNQRNRGAETSPITSVIVSTSVTGLSGRTGWQGSMLPWLPYFVGDPPQATTNTQLFLRFSVTNTNGIAYRLHAWGYRWGPRAFDTPSGPRRPVGSIFG